MGEDVHAGAATPSAAGPSLTQRIAIAAAVGIVTALVVAVVAVVTIAGVSSASSDARRLSEAGAANEHVRDALRQLAGSTTDPARRQDLVATLGAQSALVGTLAGPEVPETSRTDAREADRAYLATITDEQPRGSSSLYEAADAKRRALSAEIDEGRAAADRAVSRNRVAGAAFAGAALLVGLAASALTVRGASRALGNSLRSIGRSMRRFGDGDLDSRAPIGDDEIGLVGRSFNHLADRTARDVRFLRERSERAEQLRVVSDALDLTDDIDGINNVTRRSMSILAPGVPMELMTIASNGRMITEVVNPTAVAPECPVPDANGCVALRRGQTSIFPSSEDLNTCPFLRNRPSGSCSAVCFPVNFGGELLGVMHSTGPADSPMDTDGIELVTTMVNAVGTRLGAVRQLESTRLEASTDGLTGLANRRMLESSLWRLLREGQSFVLVVADIDRFKRLNDNYGHETGDRALQLFARVLEANVRDHDIVARYGGEEFVLVYPELSVKPAMEVIDRIRQALSRAQVDVDHGEFTASFGVTHSSVAATPDQIIRVADAGLLRAKDLGRNRVVFADMDLADEVFGANGNGGVNAHGHPPADPTSPSHTRATPRRSGRSIDGPPEPPPPPPETSTAQEPMVPATAKATSEPPPPPPPPPPSAAPPGQPPPPPPPSVAPPGGGASAPPPPPPPPPSAAPPGGGASAPPPPPPQVAPAPLPLTARQLWPPPGRPGLGRSTRRPST